LQCLHRATVIGETTAGAANMSLPYALNDWWAVAVSSGRPINPITKTNWEGVGVKPDVPVSADAALEEARRHAAHDLSAAGAAAAQRPSR
jgi:C-terminal processing protease CtpA/Prc